MKKIPTMFLRDDRDRKLVSPYPNPDAEWVFAGEGHATRKYDGTCVMVDEDQNWWSRREVKPGKTPPENWVEVDADPITGKRVGWEPAVQSSFYRYLVEAIAHETGLPFTPHTYELCGPKVNGNPEGYTKHVIVSHGTSLLFNVPRDFDGLKTYLTKHAFEGIVWHHSDGRMAKIKKRDFGI